MKLLFAIIVLLNSVCWAGDELNLLAVQEDPKEKELLQQLNTRRTYLNWHTYTAWASVGLMAATFATAPEHGSDNTHKWMGIAAGATYLTSAAFAALAPLPEGTKQSKNIIIHKNLTWIHAPAMAIAAYTGFMLHKDYEDDDNGEDEKDESSMTKLHKASAAIAAISFGLSAVLSFDWSVNLVPFGENKKDIACLFTKRF